MNWEVIVKQATLLGTLGFSCIAAPLSLANSGPSDLPNFTEEDIFIDIPQVVSATHLSQKLTEAPASITIIDRDMIRASGALKVADLFRLVPGMQVYDVHTNKSGVTYHGMTNDFPNKLEVMVNGRSVYLPLLSTVAWETMGLTVDDIDHIEVVRGSNVPTHGSNAFLGAINIITRAAVKDHRSELRTTQGSLDTENYTLRHAGSSDALQYAIAAGYESNEGIDRYNDSGASRYFNVNASLTPSLNDSLELEAGFSTGHAYRGDGDKEFAEDADFERRDHTANYQLIRWNRVQDAQKEFSLTYYHNYLELDSPTYSDQELQALLEDGFGGPLPPGTGAQANALNPLGIFKESEHGRVDMHDLEFLQTRTLSAHSDLVLGAGVRFQRAQSEVLFSNRDSWDEETRYRLFGNWEYRASPSWVFNTGAMFEHSSIAGSALSPRFAANYIIDEGQSIRAAYTSAHRMPSLLEAYGQYALVYPLGAGTDVFSRANPDIEPEENHTVELGYLKVWPDYSTQLDVRLFYEDITNGIDSYFTPDPNDTFPGDGESRIQANQASWINQGLELQLKSRLPLPLESHITFNYGYNNPKGERDRGTKRIDDLDTRAPNHTASVLFSAKPTSDTLVGLSYYYMDHSEWLEGFSQHSPRNNYTRADLTLRKSYVLDQDNELELSLIIQNLLDRRYSEFYRYNDFDRRSYLQLKFSY